MGKKLNYKYKIFFWKDKIWKWVSLLQVYSETGIARAQTLALHI